MFALEISVNGKHMLTAGVPRWLALTANLGAERVSESDDPRMNMNVFAVGLGPEGNPQSGAWQPVRIQLGDVVTVRAIEATEVDSPNAPYPGSRLKDHDGEMSPESGDV